MFYWLCYRLLGKTLSWWLQINCTSGQRGGSARSYWQWRNPQVAIAQAKNSLLWRLFLIHASPKSRRKFSFEQLTFLSWFNCFMLPDYGMLQLLQLLAIHVYALRCSTMKTKPTIAYQHIRIYYIMNVKLCTCRCFGHSCGLLQTAPLYLDINTIQYMVGTWNTCYLLKFSSNNFIYSLYFTLCYKPYILKLCVLYLCIGFLSFF